MGGGPKNARGIMARIATAADLNRAIEKDRQIEAETFIQSNEFQSKFRVDSIGVVWELETGDWQCPDCTAIVEAGEPACLCVLATCITPTGEIDTELIPF